MNGSQTALGVAMMILVVFFAVGMTLIPILDNALRRRTAQAASIPVNDNRPPEARP